MKFQHIEELEQQSDEKLFINIGEVLLAGQAGFDESSEEEKEETGRNWFNDNKDNLCRLLSETGTREKFLAVSGSNRTQYILWLADLLAANFLLVPPFTLAVLLSRTTLVTLCGE